MSISAKDIDEVMADLIDKIADVPGFDQVVLIVYTDHLQRVSVGCSVGDHRDSLRALLEGALARIADA